MLIGYRILGEDFYKELYSSEEGSSICPGCGRLLEPKIFHPNFKLGSKKRYDYIEVLLDGESIVSLKFKEFCDRWGYKDLEFVEIPTEPDWFLFRPKKIVEFDSERAGITFKNFCEICKNYHDVFGVKSVILKNITQPIEDGFFRTDVKFSWGDRQRPMVIVGLKTCERLKKEKFKGLVIRPIMLPE